MCLKGVYNFMNEKTIGLVIARVILGITFALHGLAKFQDGINGTAEFFSSVGIPSFLAYIVAGIELVGGILMVLGIFTKVVAALLIVIMLGAIGTVKYSMGFLDGFELDLALLALAVVAFTTNSWTQWFAFTPPTKAE